MTRLPEDDNPFAPPSPVKPPPALAAYGLAVVFGVLGLGTWLGFTNPSDELRWIGLVTSVSYCLPMSIAGVVLGIVGLRRPGRERWAWSAIALGALGILGLIADVGDLVLRMR